MTTVSDAKADPQTNGEIVSEVADPPSCPFCRGFDTRHVRLHKLGLLDDAWWRCLACGKDWTVRTERVKDRFVLTRRERLR